MDLVRRVVAFYVAALLAACDERPSFSKADIDAEKLLGNAPPGFLLGTATAPHQIEGGLADDWSDWEQGSYPDGRPHIKHRDTSAVADDSWNRWKDDLAAMQTLGVNAYRLGVDWSRLMPAPGQWDAAAAARYREQLAALRAAHIEPMVTLYHFTLPKWVAAQGGLEWDGLEDALADFAGRSGKAFGDLVDRWCTLNEPNVVAVKGFTQGEWPPGVKDTPRTARVLARLLRAHAKMAAALRLNDTVDADGDGKATLIGLAHHVRVFEPATWSPLDVAIAAASDAFFNDALVQAVKTGHTHLSVPGAITIDEDVPGLAGSFDYLGLNYYTRDHVRADLSDPSLSKQYTPAGAPVNDLGWELYPEGLYRMLVRFGRYGWPILITENGMADNAGDRRPEFLRGHLYAVDRARAAGVDVRGYYHWSLLDNFEWAEGYTARFGLFTVDFASDPTLARKPTPAVAVFQEAARNLGTLR